ncbi:MAG: hypothetical protein L0Z71_03505 [Anaerolineae bacterium]|nr:hypothetical protein [Anaerolineae bacterium]
MQLSNLFKKSPKQEAPKKELMKDDPFGSPEMRKKRYDAAMEFIKMFQERIPLVGGKPHAGTVLSVAARLAGTSLFRATHKKDVTPGVIVLSEEVNQAYPQLLNLFAFYCRKNGMDVMSRPLVTEFSEQDKPRMEVAEIQAEYQDQYNAIMKKYGLDYLEGARAGMIVCSIVFQYHCVSVKDIDPFVATGIIAMGVVEGTKTAPPPLGSKPVKKEKRFVLGEQDAAIQDALANGGGFMDINPEIMKMLKEKNIDPFLVYEQAVLKQMEEKIDRFDFVQADVDALFKEWNGKPSDKAPIPVRLVLWMKKNASSHGYEQSGNSWVLKQ